jgi:hypothetical protein
VKTWLRCYWDQGDIWYYFELDVNGNVTRQVELHGPMRSPLTAASLDEWRHALATGSQADYEAEYGLTAELPISKWVGHNPDWLAAEAFEEVWNAARRWIAARPR